MATGVIGLSVFSSPYIYSTVVAGVWSLRKYVVIIVSYVSSTVSLTCFQST